MKSLFVPLLGFLLCGCANVEYTSYSGAQRNWPVASGSFVQRKFDLPVYLGPPDRPYRLLGYMEVESAPLAVWETGKSESIKPAVKEAIKHGADAVILLASGTNATGSTTFTSGQWGSSTTTTGRRLRGLFQCTEPDDRRRFRLKHDIPNSERLRSRNRDQVHLVCRLRLELRHCQQREAKPRLVRRAPRLQCRKC